VELQFALIAAMLLSIERICYVWVWRAPEVFRELCAGPAGVLADQPTHVLRVLFLGFKALQLAVFAWWCLAHSRGMLWPPDGPAWALALGVALIAIGQTLNGGVFYQLGSVGVFYGNRFGHDVEWCRGFPFLLVAHPQYVGAVLSIWGLFLCLRFPHDDWLVLPILETVYYVVGAKLEQ
jgi:phosphatidyl-N-methylethanolamine N-methyltransferase